MSSSQLASILVVALGIMMFFLVALICVWIFLKFNAKKQEDRGTEDDQENKRTKVQGMYNIQSIFDFMEFDKIADNMIIQKSGKRYVMVVKCQGINYDLMSGVEKTGVEQGFIQYLNTLRYPIQIYIQTRTVDLTGSLSTYNQKVKELEDNLRTKEFNYNQKVRAGTYDKFTLDKEQFEVVKARNLYEYGLDIMKNTEAMSLNKNILTKQYYIILSYFPDEAGNPDYTEEDLRNLAFSELYTRASSTMTLLFACGIKGKILDSMDLANLLYSAYNRDEAERYNLKKALNAGFDDMYITSPDVLDKRMKELDKQMEKDAIEKANEAVFKVKDEQEKERNIRKKEEQYTEIVKKMAESLLNENIEVLGKDITEKAKTKLNEEDKTQTDKNKEEIANVQKKTRKPGRPRKTA